MLRKTKRQGEGEGYKTNSPNSGPVTLILEIPGPDYSLTVASQKTARSLRHMSMPAGAGDGGNELIHSLGPGRGVHF